jgi:phosphatidylinositol 4-kinase B
MKGDKLEKARKNFCYSLAAYSIITYILQIKDRHNANLLIDKEGHIVHIDFGFLLTNSPGHGFKFERAPFKLTNEFVQLMGGENSQGFRRFRTHLIEGFFVLNHNADSIV